MVKVVNFEFFVHLSGHQRDQKAGLGNRFDLFAIKRAHEFTGGGLSQDGTRRKIAADYPLLRLPSSRNEPSRRDRQAMAICWADPWTGKVGALPRPGNWGGGGAGRRGREAVC